MTHGKSEGDKVYISLNDTVTVTRMGHLTEIQHMEKMNNEISIRKINKDEFVYLETGEVGTYKHIENRSESYNSLRKTFKKLRYLINNNFQGNPNELLITLTYAENMRDTDKLRADMNRFTTALKKRYKDKTSVDYLSVVEPQERGAWHVHMLIRFNDYKKIYLDNNDIAKLWGWGFVRIQSLKDIDNIGAYLSAYLTDVELTSGNIFDAMKDGATVIEKEYDGEKKKFIKGGRLHMYPPNMNLFRKSQGIKYPPRTRMKYKEAKKIVGSAQPHYSKKYSIENDNFTNTVAFEQYNSKRL